MLISIFTPTHDPRYLKRCADSIGPAPAGVTVEWVVVPNNGAGEIPFQNPRMRVIPPPAGLKGVGALKRFAVSMCHGDVFVELDHDDELMPGALDVIAEHLANEKDAFFYSSCLETREDGTDVLFGSNYGWEYGDFDGHRYNRSFPANARSLCEIFYAPNHVRVWTREAYKKAGGHNADLTICDDHELLIKTYLAGTKFIQHDLPLYHQHYHKGNTQYRDNAAIQVKQAELRNRYLVALVEEECRRRKLPMYDLGGAHSCPEGYIPVDQYEVPGGIRWDMAANQLGFLQTDSVGCIRAHDFLEHIPIGRVVPLMNDIHRVLQPGMWLLSMTPSTDGRGAYQDPTHVSFWNENSWWYYTRKQQARYVPEIKAQFQAVQNFTTFPSDWHKQHNISYVIGSMVALKGQRQAGGSTLV